MEILKMTRRNCGVTPFAVVSLVAAFDAPAREAMADPVVDTGSTPAEKISNRQS
jgi:hypothetical protein